MNVAIPSEKLTCLLEYRSKYLELERNVIIFTPEYCPAISREEIQEFVQNSAGPDTSTKLLFLLKADFVCLVNKIEAHLSADEAADAESTDIVEFQLDCE